MRCAGATGIVITLWFLLIFITSTCRNRRCSNSRPFKGRKCCGHRLFWRVHKTWWWLYLLLLLHAPDPLWIWFFFPFVCVLVDRLLLHNQTRPFAALISATHLNGDVLKLVFKVPEGFKYQAGQYIMLHWQGEWHPFTLTSAPEEKVLSVHIRSVESLDWCSALRTRLIEDAPATAGLREGKIVEYQGCFDK